MVRKVMAAIALVACVFSTAAQAQVVSSYGQSIVPPEAPSTAGYDGVFFLRSRDGDYKMSFYSRIQFQHFFQNMPSSAAGAVDYNTFLFRRARFVWTADVKNFNANILVNHGTFPTAAGQSVVNFFAADMTATIVPQFYITVGTTAAPMDRAGEGSSGKMAFPEASLTATQEDGIQDQTIARQAFGNPTTLGIRLGGDVGRFHYIVGAVNGDSWLAFNTTRQFAYGARTWVDILGNPGNDETDFAYTETPAFAIGGGTAFDPQDAVDANINGVTVDWAWTSSGDLAFKWRGLSLIGEAYYRRLDVATGGFSLTDVGYNANAGYFILPKKLEIVGRGAQMFREGPTNNAWEFSGGINWYIYGNNVKFQTAYTRTKNFAPTVSGGTAGVRTDQVRTLLTLQI